MFVTFTRKSGNEKTGPIGVSTTERKSCPKECIHDNTDCYARFGPLAIWWRAVRENGDNWAGFCRRIAKLPQGFIWRHNQAGDLPKKKGVIDRRKLEKLVIAAKQTRVWTYTHFNPHNRTNRAAIRYANRNGFVVNLSADSLKQADRYYKLGIGPVVCTLPADNPTKRVRTPGGLPVITCLTQTRDDITCQDCLICLKKDRKFIVGFLAHGTAKKRLSAKLRANQ